MVSLLFNGYGRSSCLGLVVFQNTAAFIANTHNNQVPLFVCNTQMRVLLMKHLLNDFEQCAQQNDDHQHLHDDERQRNICPLYRGRDGIIAHQDFDQTEDAIRQITQRTRFGIQLRQPHPRQHQYADNQHNPKQAFGFGRNFHGRVWVGYALM